MPALLVKDGEQNFFATSTLRGIQQEVEFFLSVRTKKLVAKGLKLEALTPIIQEKTYSACVGGVSLVLTNTPLNSKESLLCGPQNCNTSLGKVRTFLAEFMVTNEEKKLIALHHLLCFIYFYLSYQRLSAGGVAHQYSPLWELVLETPRSCAPAITISGGRSGITTTIGCVYQELTKVVEQIWVHPVLGCVTITFREKPPL